MGQLSVVPEWEKGDMLQFHSKSIGSLSFFGSSHHNTFSAAQSQRTAQFHADIVTLKPTEIIGFRCNQIYRIRKQCPIDVSVAKLAYEGNA